MPTAPPSPQVPTPVNQNAVSSAASGKTGTVTPRNLSAEAQHVIDALEAHWNALVAWGQSGHPAAVQTVAKFGDDVLGKLDAWGVEFRGQLQALETPAGNSIAASAEQFLSAGQLAPTTLVTTAVPTVAVAAAGTIAAGDTLPAGTTVPASVLHPAVPVMAQPQASAAIAAPLGLPGNGQTAAPAAGAPAPAAVSAAASPAI